MVDLIECEFYEPDPGDRIRILVNYENSWRPLIWLKVGKDGSIYLAPRVTQISYLEKGALISKDEKFHVKYADGEEIKEPNLKKKSEIIFSLFWES